MDMVFLVDTSHKMAPYYEIAMLFMRLMLEGLDFRFESAKVGFVTFDSTSKLRFDLDAYTTKSDLEAAFTLPHVGGNPRLTPAMDILKVNI